VFANRFSPGTIATFDAPGMYLLRLTAHDTELLTADDVSMRP